MNKYQIIYADCPWSFSSKELQKYGGKRFTSMDKHYPTQHKDWIKNLPVKNITADDCALFLWVTDAHLKEGIEVIEAWGFKYITRIFNWNKKTINGLPACTMGAWTIKDSEMVLFGTKGKMLQYKKDNCIRQAVSAIRPPKHSQKPDEVRKRIEQLFGNLPRIELFAREKTGGWDSWGNEVESDIEL